MPITPPNCKTCGVAEWNHTCRTKGKSGVKLAPSPVKSRIVKTPERATPKPRRPASKGAT